MNKEYILMCREAKEIQDLWDTAPGSKYYHERFGYGHVNYEFATDQSEYIWLPQQEDLQNIIREETRLSEFTIFQDFAGLKYTPDEWSKFIDHFSFRTYWLLFTMETCFNKTWNWETKKWEAIP